MPANKAHSFYLPLPALKPGQREHQMFVSTRGNPQSHHAIVILHGGPGYHTNADDFDMFLLNSRNKNAGDDDDEQHQQQQSSQEPFFLIRYDQRYCGMSLPSFEPQATSNPQLAGNDIDIEGEVRNPDLFSVEVLINDLDYLRKHFGFEKWTVFGHSWGTTLALCYAATFPQHVSGLILFGTYLADAPGHELVYGRAAAERYPEAFAVLASVGGLDEILEVRRRSEINDFNQSEQEQVDKQSSRWENLLWTDVFDAYRPKVLRSNAAIDMRPTAVWLLYEDYVTADDTSEREYVLQKMKECASVAVSTSSVDQQHQQQQRRYDKETATLLETYFYRLRGQSVMQLVLLRDFASKFDFINDDRFAQVFSDAQNKFPIFFLQGAADDCCPDAALQPFVAKLKAAGARVGYKVLENAGHGLSDAVKMEILAAALRVRSLVTK